MTRGSGARYKKYSTKRRKKNQQKTRKKKEEAGCAAHEDEQSGAEPAAAEEVIRIRHAWAGGAPVCGASVVAERQVIMCN